MSIVTIGGCKRLRHFRAQFMELETVVEPQDRPASWRLAGAEKRLAASVGLRPRIKY
jgi:hypothetical protein